MHDPARPSGGQEEQDPAALEALAQRSFERRCFDEALSYQRQAHSLYVALDLPAEQAQCSQSIGYLCLLLRDHEGAEHAYREAIGLRGRIGDRRGEAMGWGRLAELFQRAGRHVEALAVFDTALGLLRHCDALHDVGIVLNNMAVSHRELGDREPALRCQERAIEIRKALGDGEGLAASLHNMGVLHTDSGFYDLAKDSLEEARRLRAAAGDSAGLASTELRLGILLEQQGQHALAMDRYERAAEMYADVPGGRDDLAVVLCNLAGLQIGQGNAESAAKLLETATSLLQPGGDTPSHACVDYHIGLLRFSQAAHDDALVAFASAERVQRRCGDVRSLSATLAARAVIQAKRGEVEPARQLLLEALDHQIRLCEIDAQVHTLKLLAQCQSLQGDEPGCQHYLEQAYGYELLLKAAPQSHDQGTGRSGPVEAQRTTVHVSRSLH